MSKSYLFVYDINDGRHELNCAFLHGASGSVSENTQVADIAYARKKIEASFNAPDDWRITKLEPYWVDERGPKLRVDFLFEC